MTHAPPRRPLVSPWFWLAFLAAGLTFLLVPAVDLGVSSLFYRAPEGFPLHRNGLLRVVHQAIEWLAWLLPAALLGLLAVAVLRPAGRFGGWRRPLVYLLLVLLLGPGLLVNGLLKEHVERARPSQVTEFGGTRQFTPPFLRTQECEQNCAFVSGHAAMGFSLLGAAFLAPPATRRRWLAAGLACGGLVGLMRIAQGGHWLSDVVFAGFFVYLVAALAHRLVFRGQAPGPDAAAQASSLRVSASP